MLRLNTITKAYKMFDTGQKPLLFSCDDEDYSEWVCKYDRNKLNLFYELISVEFAKIWGIKVPESALINVKKDHLRTEDSLSSSLFNSPCFGSKLIRHSKDLDLTLMSLFQDKKFLNKLNNKEDLFLIGMFDIWLSNEDRNHNNCNLLLDISDSKCNLIYAIDHGAIFNTGSSLPYGIYEITEDESIINTIFGKIIYESLTNPNQLVNEIIEKLHTNTEICKSRIESIVYMTPTEWAIDLPEQIDLITKNIFTETWLKKCEKNFQTIIQSTLVTKKVNK